jgi:hypothetical protein
MNGSCEPLPDRQEELRSFFQAAAGIQQLLFAREFNRMPKSLAFR